MGQNGCLQTNVVFNLLHKVENQKPWYSVFTLKSMGVVLFMMSSTKSKNLTNEVLLSFTNQLQSEYNDF